MDIRGENFVFLVRLLCNKRYLKVFYITIDRSAKVFKENINMTATLLFIQFRQIFYMKSNNIFSRFKTDLRGFFDVTKIHPPPPVV